MSPSAPTRTNFTVDGHPTAAWVHSSGSSARPVLMVHGFRGDHHGMDLIAGAIRDRDVIVGDLPGFGLTPPLATGLSLDAYCDHLAGLVAEVTRRWQAAPIVLGHSFGSILVAHTAARQPSTAPELILINPITTPALEGSAKVLTALTRLYYGLGARLPETIGHQLLANPVIVRAMSEVMATTRDRGLRRYIHDQHARHFSTFSDRTSLAEAFDVSVAHTVTEVAGQLSMPMLVIAGDKDAIAPIAATRRFVSDLADAKFVELSGVGHLVHYERPDAAASAIMDFCRGRD
ncbi:alpha/beta hydrolase [Brevibacterium sp. BDJS002]|uniref:Alpha/beta hydrolase n=1 Tax=Brevibacterium aurantiacum TaxID=273384 RepID=A0A2A3ZD10_BREAU|nr:MULTISPECIES: alpha/beta hydrolase [Brevibacterium]PCC49377.1 alpha/beta hydrolase [Brevibacterium aurantiacum]TGD39700.1 alpha/beta hydrolase [Brevibacterium aurantiacum]WCE41896.1 alpha/beta hydrolase [Brevibacterium sp. BDJS002]SMX72669.1 Pimeloyl-ACP methyl ester carboxylesterase [Brevibacterium aurantiacum]